MPRWGRSLWPNPTSAELDERIAIIDDNLTLWTVCPYSGGNGERSSDRVGKQKQELETLNQSDALTRTAGP